MWLPLGILFSHNGSLSRPFHYASPMILPPSSAVSSGGSRLILSYRYRLYPSPGQLAGFNHVLTELNYLWNYALAERRDAWFGKRRHVSYIDQQTNLKKWRAYDVLGLGAISYDHARDCLQRLDLAYSAAFRRIRERKWAGFPRFRRDTNSFTGVPDFDPWVQTPTGSWRLKIPKIGEVQIRRHRPPPPARVSSVTVSCEGREWYAILQYNVPDPPLPSATQPISPVGVDLGLAHLATLSTGETVETSRFFLQSQRPLKRLQRALSRKQRGSNRYERQRERIVRCHAKIRRRRRYWAHRWTSRWAEDHDLVVFEDFNIASFAEGNRLAKGMLDAGWGLLRQMTAYKEQLRSGRYLEVAAPGTSQTCSVCGQVANPRLRLSTRIFVCPCGLKEDRDVNAARNILNKGLDQLRRNTAEGRRVDGTPPLTKQGRRAYQRKRELKCGEIGPAAVNRSVGVQDPQAL